MRFYRKETVLEAAKQRIRYLFSEFDKVVVDISGGKDSDVVLRLTLEVAEELGRLPVPVRFIDQEAEWQGTVEHVRELMALPGVEPMWIQVPFRIYNATSFKEHWLTAWGADEPLWMRERESDSIKENVYGTDRFQPLFQAITRYHWGDQRVAQIGGVRGEESPTRLVGLTTQATYKWITWGQIQNRKRGHFVFYPLYDWSYMDVWKAIHDHGWSYNRVYDAQWQRGYRVRDMRISNLHHETSLMQLWFLQEIEPDTYARLTQRLEGIDTAAKMGRIDYFPSELPSMFADWRDYRDHLARNLLDEETRASMERIFEGQERRLGTAEPVMKAHVKAIMANDWEGVKLAAFADSYRGRLKKKARKEAEHGH